VMEPLLFRHFGSKAELFESAVFLPLGRQLTEYRTGWLGRRRGYDGMVDRSREFVATLYDHLRENRSLFRAYVLSAQSDELGAVLSDIAQPLVRYLDQLAEPAGRSVAEADRLLDDPALTVRMTFGMVFTTAVFDDLLYAPGRAPGRDEVVAEMTAYLLHGIDRPREA
jgi:AcrR family transcriptional regulator